MKGELDPASTRPVRLHASPRKHMAEGTIRVFLAEALLLPTGLITAAFLTRKFGPAGYGLFTVAASIVAWIEWSITATFSRAAFKLVADAEDWRPIGGAIVRVFFVTGAASAIGLWLLAPPLELLLKVPRLAHSLRLFALDIPIFSLAQAHRGILVGTGEFAQRATVTAVRWMVRLALVVILVDLGLSISGAIVASIGASLCELACCRLYVRPRLFGRTDFPVIKLGEYVLPLFFFAVSMRLLDKLDLLMLQGLRGNVPESGMYGAAQNLTLVANLFALSFGPLLLSTLSRMTKLGELDMAKRTARDAVRAILALLPFAAMTSGAAAQICVSVFGRDFVAAAIPLRILIFGSIGTAAISVITAIMTALGRPRLTVGLTAPLVFIAAGGYLYCVPKFGSLGAAGVSTGVSVLGAVAALIALQRVCSIAFPGKSLLRSAVVSVVAYVLAIMVPASNMFSLGIKLAVIGLIILGLFAALREFSMQELASIRQLFGRPASALSS